MDGKEQDKIMAFDTLFTTNQIQKMKVLMAYLDPYVQKTLAICIKIMELQYTLSFFRVYPNASMQGLPHEDNFNTEKLMDEMLPYCTPEEQNKINQMKNTLQSFAGMQETMQMIQSLKEMFPEGDGSFQGNMSDILSGMAGMNGFGEGGMDLSQLLNLFQTNENGG